MRINSIHATGIVTKDGKLSMYMGALNDFFSSHRGERIVSSFEAVPSGGLSAMIRYYMGYIVPEVRRTLAAEGTIMGKGDTDYFLRRKCPLCWEERENGGRFEVTRIREAGELDREEMGWFLEWVRVWCAENLYLILEDPKTL